MELWIAASPNGWKVSIMLEELKEAGIELPEVEVKNLSLMDGDQFSDEFTAVNPNQKIPGLVDGNVRIMEILTMNLATLVCRAAEKPGPCSGRSSAPLSAIAINQRCRK